MPIWKDLMTHGGRKAKRFDWVFQDDFVKITNEDQRQHVYSLDELFTVLSWLADIFLAGWFPLANNVEKLITTKKLMGLAYLSYAYDNIRKSPTLT
jgi:hypothetical protein